jgi:hypothetical protein
MTRGGHTEASPTVVDHGDIVSPHSALARPFGRDCEEQAAEPMTAAEEATSFAGAPVTNQARPEYRQVGGPQARPMATQALAEYVDAFGWSVRLGDGGLMLDCGQTVDAITMPMGLAGEVNHILMTHGLTAPVLETGKETRLWAFLTIPKPMEVNDAVVRLLSLHDVKHLGVGQTVRLPMGAEHRNSPPRWIVPPSQSPGLPPWNALVMCALMAVRR